MDDILNQFPPVSFAFAYGSGVIEQTNHSDENNNDISSTLIDIILVVENTQEWHSQNMAMNSGDYSSIIPFSPQNIAFLQEKFMANIWYNVYVSIKSMPNRKMKYGVISKEDLLRDVTTWTCLYIAGRLHKPIYILKDDPEIQSNIRINYENAVRASLLLLPHAFNEIDLYRCIASLSYIGDPRMFAGENPKKVVNLISEASLPLYRNIYSSSVNKMNTEKFINVVCSTRGVYTQEMSTTSRWKLAVNLPLTMRRVLLIKGRERRLPPIPPGKTAIRGALASIVARAATAQSVKGILTAGVFNCTVYVAAKVMKRFGWLRRLKTSFVSHSTQSV